ncbi:small-conductance mechanosensitive channel [Canibacter oris]|uniref:Small-conductance mechanosensitive channel n=1 Tax=Canibacter oris TaxID=1365628 RepID=A0A840DD41_9MICO|nr:small-conductance mechanosensitive channel [Canibacter oris]
MILALEIFFLALLGLASASIAFVSGTVIYNLFKGQK